MHPKLLQWTVEYAPRWPQPGRIASPRSASLWSRSRRADRGMHVLLRRPMRLNMPIIVPAKVHQITHAKAAMPNHVQGELPGFRRLCANDQLSRFDHTIELLAGNWSTLHDFVDIKSLDIGKFMDPAAFVAESRKTHDGFYHAVDCVGRTRLVERLVAVHQSFLQISTTRNPPIALRAPPRADNSPAVSLPSLLVSKPANRASSCFLSGVNFGAFAILLLLPFVLTSVHHLGTDSYRSRCFRLSRADHQASLARSA